MTDEDTSEHNWPSGADVKIVTSSDGISWENKIRIFGVQTVWPGLMALDSTNFLVLGDNNGAKAQLVSL